MQQYEESRINFTKYNLDKFLKHLTNFGQGFHDQSNQAVNTVSEANANIDLNKFIEKNITENEFPNKTILFENFTISEDLQRYKEFLAE